MKNFIKIIPDWTPIKNANTVVMELLTNSYIRKADFHHMAQPTYVLQL